MSRQLEKIAAENAINLAFANHIIENCQNALNKVENINTGPLLGRTPLEAYVDAIIKEVKELRAKVKP